MALKIDDPGSRIDAATPGQVNLAVVPEPSAAALLALLAGGTTIFPRARRRSGKRKARSLD